MAQLHREYDIVIGTICVLIVSYDEGEGCMLIWLHEIYSMVGSPLNLIIEKNNKHYASLLLCFLTCFPVPCCDHFWCVVGGRLRVHWGGLFFIFVSSDEGLGRWLGGGV